MSATDTPHFRVTEFACPCGNKACGGSLGVLKQELLDALERVRLHWGKPMTVTSGVRCLAHNSAIGGARRSAHLTGQAADIADPRGQLKSILTEDFLASCGLWMEHADDTGGKSATAWCHLQTRPTASRIFRR